MSDEHCKDLAYGIDIIYGKEAGDKIESLCETFKVDKLADIPDKYYKMIVDKIKSKIDDTKLLNMIKEVFKNDIVPLCPKCEIPMYRRGLFYFCSKCHKLVNA